MFDSPAPNSSARMGKERAPSLRIAHPGRWTWLFGLIVTLAAAPVIAAVTPGGAAEKGAGGSGQARQARRVAGQYADVSDPALARALEALAPTGALTAFPGDAFRPSRAVTLGEFARAAAAAFGVTVPAGRPAESGAVEALVERGVLPRSQRLYEGLDLPVSVGNVMSAAVRLAGMDDIGRDWPADDPVAAGMALARAAGIMPESVTPQDASRPATRAEAVQALYLARRLSTVSGTLELKGAGTAEIQTELGSVRVRLGESTVVVRNGRPASPEQLLEGDRVAAVVDVTGQARVLAASGSGLALDLDGTRLVAMAQRVLEEMARQLTPEQWQMLLQGDWQAFSATVMPQLYDRLTAMGIAPWEADALVNRDWEALRSLAADRLAQEAGQRFDISPELVRSVLDFDWATARRLAQQELIERIINDVIVPNARTGQTAG